MFDQSNSYHQNSLDVEIFNYTNDFHGQNSMDVELSQLQFQEENNGFSVHLDNENGKLSSENIEYLTSSQTNLSKNEITEKCQYYINLIKQKIKLKYSNEIQTDNNQDMDKKAGKIKKKLISKTPKNFSKPIDLLQLRLNASKKHTSQLWGNRVILFLKSKMKNYHIRPTQIKRIKKSIVRNLTIPQLSQLLMQHPCICKVIEKEQKDFIDSIYQSQNLMDQSKQILFETYNIFMEGLKRPQNLKTWNHEMNIKLKQSEQIYQKFKNKDLNQIIQIAHIYVQQEKNKYKLNKCSFQNNTTYYWMKYLKDLIYEKKFKKKYSKYQQYSNLLSYVDLRTPSIENIRNALSINWFAEYVLETKINNALIIKQIIMNLKINLLKKMNMIISLPSLINGLKDPFELFGWME